METPSGWLKLKLALFLSGLTLVFIICGLVVVVSSSLLLSWLFGGDCTGGPARWGNLVGVICVLGIAEKYLYPVYKRAARKWKGRPSDEER